MAATRAAGKEVTGSPVDVVAAAAARAKLVKRLREEARILEAMDDDEWGNKVSTDGESRGRSAPPTTNIAGGLASDDDDFEVDGNRHNATFKRRKVAGNKRQS